MRENGKGKEYRSCHQEGLGERMHYQFLLGSCRIAACSTDPVASATSRQGADNFELRDRPTSVSISKDQGSGRSPSRSFDRRAARWQQRRQKPRQEEQSGGKGCGKTLRLRW